MNEYLTGIYKITNRINENFYIGSARISFKKRWSVHQHLLIKNRHKNKHLQRSVNKYGYSNFDFEIVEIVIDQNEILNREQYYIDLLKPKYNNTTNVRQPMLGRTVSEETRKLLSDSHKGKSAWNKGKSFSVESRLKMSLAKKGLKRKNIRKGYGKPVIRSDGVQYRNTVEAALSLNVKPNTITKAITDKSIIRKVKGYTFKYY